MGENAFGAVVPDSINVLLVEDDPDHAMLVELKLMAASPDGVRVHHRTTVEDGLSALDEDAIDLILLDLSLPDGDGLDNIERFSSASPLTPILVLTSRSDHELAVAAVRRGAHDYLVKHDIDDRFLLQAVRHAIARQGLLVELAEAKDRESLARDRFMSHVSHELRTPLTAVHHFVTILQEHIAGELNDKQQEYVGIVQRNISQLKKMIGDLMDVTRLENGKMSLETALIDLPSVIQTALEAVSPAARDKSIELRSRTGDGLRSVVADSARLEQVIVNLLGNAIKFTPESGWVSVAVELDPADDERVQIVVEDNGCGLPDDGAQRVFSRLFHDDRNDARSRQGLGLGLHISKEIVSMHGGSIAASDREGGGARFVVSLPAYSLDNIVTEWLSRHDRIGEVSLVAITCPDRLTRDSSMAYGRRLRELHRILDECTIRSNDVVLPMVCDASDPSDPTALVACGRTGAAVVAARIREALGNSMIAKGCEFDVVVESMEFDPHLDVRSKVGRVLDGLAYSGAETPACAER